MRKFIRWSIALLLFCLTATTVEAGIDVPIVKVLNGSIGQLKKDSSIMVEDAKFFNTAYDAILIKPYTVKNMISLEINEEARVVMQSDFTYDVWLEITYTDVNKAITTIVRKFTVNYSASSGYGHRATFLLNNAYRVQVRVDSVHVVFPVDVAAWDAEKTLKVVNQLQAFPMYKFDCSNNAVKEINKTGLPANTDLDELHVWWTPAMGADEYDLEWTYVDAAALADSTYGDPNSPNASLIFENNSSRVTITGSQYKIPLFYDTKGTLFFRVRSVQWISPTSADGGRYEANWSSQFGTNGLGKLVFNGHEDSLNWQSSTSFAEEGKRKTVMQYFDGSLRGRQTVTKDNSTERTIVAENLYDYQGRPVIQVLPAPTINTLINYTPNFTRGINRPDYDKSLYDTLADPSLYCNIEGIKMDTTSGASRYYSPANDSALSTLARYRYIPDAKGFPFTEVEYRQDNTGRIAKQSGVGPEFKMGSGRETRYFYATPDQKELDALFGTEVGDKSHYFKNAVRDANGQYSISYVDMRGRTIATALAGNVPDSIKLDKLSSNNVATTTETLADPSSVVIRDLVMENKKGLLVTTADLHTFTYQLNPRVLQLAGCDPKTFCYDCLYDLQITISDDCNNQKIGFNGAPFDTLIRNFSINAIDTSCSQDSGFSFTFSKWLPEGSYEITKKLMVSRYGKDFYRDSVFLRNPQCRDFESFVREQRNLAMEMAPCKPTCTGCTDSVGTWQQFWDRFRSNAGISNADSASWRTAAETAYAEAIKACNLICGLEDEVDEVREAMLQDMTPSSGQYANGDFSGTDIYSIFKKNGTLVGYQTMTNYKNGEGKLDSVYDDATGIRMPPQKLSQTKFIDQFKSSWAASLLPLHPEYCKLTKYEFLKESFAWDKRFEAVDSYAEARQKGYLNPFNKISPPFSYFSATGAGDYDALRTLLPTHAAEIEAAMVNFRSLNEQPFSIWGVAAITAVCPDGNDATCYNRYRVGPALDTASTLCDADRDLAWRSFQQMFLQIKRTAVNNWIKAQCTETPTAKTLTDAGHQAHFGDANEMLSANGITLPTTLPEANDFASQYGQKEQEYYAANCSTYVKHWVEVLSKCGQYPLDSIRNVIVPRLLRVCREGSDSGHPYGSSSVKPSSTYNFRSFEDVLRHYNQTHSLLVGVRANNCDPYGIISPRPYDQQSVHSNKPLTNKPDSCECTLIGQYRQKYEQVANRYGSFSAYMQQVYNTSVTDSVLNLMIGLCNGMATCDFRKAGLTLPPAFQCNSGDICIECEKFTALEKDFIALYPNVIPLADVSSADSMQKAHTALYERFFNYRLGFTKTAREYLDFYDQCNGVRSSRCDTLQRIVTQFMMSRQNVYGVTTKFKTAELQEFTNLRQIIHNGTIQLPDTIRVKPNEWYNNVEWHLNSGKFCWSNGYAVEVRFRFLKDLLTGDVFYLNAGNVHAVFFRVAYPTIVDGVTLDPGIYLKSVGSPQYGSLFTGFHLITTDHNILLDFTAVKFVVTPSSYSLFFNGTKTKEIARNPALPIVDGQVLVLGLRGRQGNVDWIKCYDAAGSVKYFEDYADPFAPVLPAENYRCPGAIPACASTFVTYFNQTRGTNYTFSQIESLYASTCGKALNVCGTGDTLKAILKRYNVNAHPYRLVLACQSNDFPVGSPYREIMDPAKIIGDGYMRFPDTLRALNDRNWFYHQIVAAPTANFCVQNGYTVEMRLRNLRNVLLPDNDAFYYQDQNTRFALFKQESGTPGLYLTDVRARDASGNLVVISTGNYLVDTDPNAFSNRWNLIKIVVTTTRVMVFYNGKVIRDFAKASAPMVNIPAFTCAFFGYQGALDWVRMFDHTGAQKMREDFNDHTDRTAISASFLCPNPTADIQPSLTNYFNAQLGTSHTFKKLDSLFLAATGRHLNTGSNLGLPTILNDYKELELGRGSYNYHGNTFDVSNPQELFDSGYIKLPPRYDTIAPYCCVSATHFGGKPVCLPDGYLVEVSVKATGWALATLAAISPDTTTAGGFFAEFLSNATPVIVNNTFQDGRSKAVPVLPGGGPVAGTLTDWHVLGVKVTRYRYELYVDGKLLKVYDKVDRLRGQPVGRITGWYVSFGSMTGLVDWIKLSDNLGVVHKFEDFTDPANMAPLSKASRCTKPDCRTDFAAYYSVRKGTTYSVAQVDSIYRVNGYNLDACEPANSNLTLCGRSQPSFPGIAIEEVNNCTDSTFFIQSKAKEIHKTYLDSLRNYFDSAYTAHCMQAYKYERFTVRRKVSEYHYTLYYYDQAGNLVKTIPPAGVNPNRDSLWLESIRTARTAGTFKVPDHALPTQYRYNTLNQVMAQKSPDGGQTAFWYDRLGRLAISQNARQKAVGSSNDENRLYSYTQYDHLGRITEVGQVKNLASNEVMTDAISRNAGSLKNWLAALNTRREQVTQTIYDTAYIGLEDVIDGQTFIYQRNLRNRVSFTTFTDGLKNALSNAYNQSTFYSYDIHGNVDTLLQDYGSGSGDLSIYNLMNRNGNRFKKIAYQYDLISGKVNMVMYQRGWKDQFFHRYSYDAENRLTLVETSLDSMVWEKDTRYEYYLHGPLARTVLGGQQVQGLDYAYTLQGWLKGVNSTGATSTHDMGSDGRAGNNQFIARDAYGFNLNYFGGDYAAINPSVNPFPHYSARLNTEYRPLYNGNISSIASTVRRFEDGGQFPDSPSLFYNYRYDQLNRLSGMDVYNKFNRTGNNFDQLALLYDSAFGERIRYDANGNIQQYHRNGNKGQRAMDELTYEYYPGTNRLRRIRDTVEAGRYGGEYDVIKDIDDQGEVNNYVYDEIGNLLQDKAELIDSIKWNVYGKITEIKRASTPTWPVTRLSFTYDAQGNRISKLVQWGNEKRYTWYVRDAQGNVMSTYQARHTSDNLQDFVLNQGERYIYGSSRLGTYALGESVDGGPPTMQWYSGGVFVRGWRQYELTNHLGNVLTTISDKKKGIPDPGNSSLISHYEPDMVSATEYYPFGMPMRLATTSAAGEVPYRYGFNGKEHDWEAKGWMNSVDYGFRVYDPRIGRFLSVDPLTKDFPWYTPYQFAGNKPIWAIDLDGLEEQTASTYVHIHMPKPKLNGIPKSPSESTSAALSLGSFRMDKVSYDNSTWWIPATKGGVFAHNSAVSGVNQTIGMAEFGLKVFSKEGRKEQRKAIGNSLLKGLFWLAKDDDEKIEDVKAILSDVNTYEDFAGGLLLGKGTNWVLNPRMQIPLSASSKGLQYLVKITMVEDNVMIFSSKIGDKVIEGITNFRVADDVLYLDQLHLQGSAGGQVGREALWKMAKDLGKQHNVKQVVIQGGKRTTGKYKGTVPSPITIKVE